MSQRLTKWRRKNIPAQEFVRKMKDKHLANPMWVWDLLEDEYNMDRDLVWHLTQEEAARIEQLVIDGLE